jgi:hypothetical protein
MEPDVDMRREGLAEWKSRASPPEAAGLLRVPRRAALRVSPLRAAIADVGLGGGARRRYAFAALLQSAARRLWGRSPRLSQFRSGSAPIANLIWVVLTQGRR